MANPLLKLKLTLLLYLSVSLSLFSQEFTGFTVRQMGDNLNIVYSVEGEQLGEQFTVLPGYSVDGGLTFRPMQTVWGNVGPGVPGGRNQMFVWNVLEDTGSLQGDIIFRLEATPMALATLQEEVGDMLITLVSLHRMANKQPEIILNITNNGKQRDLKIFNRLIALTDFDGRRHEAQWGSIGGVTGGERYSAPQKTIKSGETVEARFRFARVPEELDRVMRLDIGTELLTITWGVELETGNVQFRDLPVMDSPPERTAVSSDLASGSPAATFEALTTAVFNIGWESPGDNEPPLLVIISPEVDDITGGVLTVREETIEIRGKATDESGISQVLVNGREVAPQDDGSFTASVTLQGGHNEITIRAVDTRFNSTEKKIAVHRTAPPGDQAASDLEELNKILASAGLIQTTTLPVGPDPQEPEDIVASRHAARNYAFIVGVDDYLDPGILPLQNPVSDAWRLASVLTGQYMFDMENVILLENATRAQIIDHFDWLARRLTGEDNLLIFFAGHGIFDMQIELGFWLPTDAQQHSTANWMANSQIRDYVGAIKSRHTLLIADACFSGSIFQTRKTFAETTRNIDRAYTNPSRKAMTSGNLQEVPDDSIFLRYLVKRLEENSRSYILAEELFSSFKPVVISQTSTVPQYGDIKGTGDEGGDFVFIRRN